MSEQARRHAAASEQAARHVEFAPGRAVVSWGVDAHLLGSVTSGGPSGSSAAGWGGNRNSRIRRSGSVRPPSHRNPHWYRRLAVGASIAGGIAFIVIYLMATRGAL